MPATHATITDKVENFHDFGCRDKYGRAIGCKVSTYILTAVEITDPATQPANWWGETGTHFALYCQATRAGVSYGASQSARYFTTDAERAKALAKYLADAAKRAPKIAAK